MSSFHTVNFAVRPNKSVERKLVFEALRALDPPFSFKRFRYLGLGGIWFTDFVLAHRTLRIDHFHSVQEHSSKAERARFNRPFATVEVSEGKSTNVLPTLSLNSQRAIVWMDYDTAITGPVLQDI